MISSSSDEMISDSIISMLDDSRLEKVESGSNGSSVKSTEAYPEPAESQDIEVSKSSVKLSVFCIFVCLIGVELENF